MKEPTVQAMAKLKRVARFIQSYPRLVQEFHEQPPVNRITMKVDADHAGCLRTRKSTTGLQCCGDDFFCIGPDDSLTWFYQQLQLHMAITEKYRIGFDANDPKEMCILNRTIRCIVNDDGSHSVEFECDSRHSEVLLHKLGLCSRTKGCATPGIKEKANEIPDDRLLPQDQQKLFRSEAMRVNYIAQDRPELLFAG